MKTSEDWLKRIGIQDNSMKSIDYFMSTPDETFNFISQEYYNKYKDEAMLRNDIHQEDILNWRYEVFIQMLHDAYFFIKENKDAPIACVSNIDEISARNKLTKNRKVELIDITIRIIVDRPEIERETMVMVMYQLYKHRERIKPYDGITLFLTIEDIKTQLEEIKDPKKRLDYLNKLKFDFEVRLIKCGEIEKIYYDKVNVKQFIFIEIERATFEMQPEQNNDDATLNDQAKKMKGENMNLDLLDSLVNLKMTSGVMPTPLDSLKKDLRAFVPNYNGKEITALADVIFRSNTLNKQTKQPDFSEWLKQFCRIIDVKVPTSKQNAVKAEYNKLKGVYWYLIP